MDFGTSPVYEIELWTPNGFRMADVSRLAQKRSITLTRNEAGMMSFEMDLAEWEDFCASQDIADPRVILRPYHTEIRVKRAGVYWKGFQVVSISYDISGRGEDAGFSPSLNQRMTVYATGFLNLFKDRYVTVTYTQIDAAEIPENLITNTQSQTNGDMGVTIWGSNYKTGVLRDRTYERQNVKRGIQNLTKLVNGRFDFDFTPEKQFRIYEQLGSVRTDLQLVFGGDGSNITSLRLDSSATNLHNYIIGLGSGFGDDQLVSIQGDAPSQSLYYRREAIKQYNSVIEQVTLDNNTAAALDLEKELLEIPEITITGKELENVPFLNVGDRVPIAISGHPSLAHINGLYRIEEMVIDIDDNDFEREIRLYFDDYGVTDDEA